MVHKYNTMIKCQVSIGGLSLASVNFQKEKEARL